MAPPRKKQKLRGSDGRFIKADTEPTSPSPEHAQAQAETGVPAYQAPTEPAIQRLLDTVEIVELILLHLPIRDLLFSTRVSKTWHHIIHGSISLRRALFFEPVSCGSVSYLDWRYDDKAMYPESPKLGEHIRGPKRNRRPSIYPRHWGKGRSDAGQYRVFVSPLLVEMFPFLKPDGCYFKETLQDLPEAARYVFASWRRMYFTQPPVGTLVLEWDNDEGEEGEDEDAEDNDDGSGAVVTIPIPTIPTTNPPTAAPTLPVPVTPGLGGPTGTNGAGAGNAGAGNAAAGANGAGAGGGNGAGNSRGDDADWTVSCFSKWTGSKGMCMEELFYRLEDIGCPAWIDGRDLWEEYSRAEDLGRVVVREERK